MADLHTSLGKDLVKRVGNPAKYEQSQGIGGHLLYITALWEFLQEHARHILLDLSVNAQITTHSSHWLYSHLLQEEGNREWSQNQEPALRLLSISQYV